MRHTNDVTVNRNYKDTIFRMLFSDKKNLLSLHNAVNGRSYTNPEKLEFLHRSLLYFIMEQGKQMTGKP